MASSSQLHPTDVGLLAQSPALPAQRSSPSTDNGLEDEKAAIINRKSENRALKPPPYEQGSLLPKKTQKRACFPVLKSSIKRHPIIWLCVPFLVIAVVRNNSLFVGYKKKTQSYIESLGLDTTGSLLEISFEPDQRIELHYRRAQFVYPKHGTDIRDFSLDAFEAPLYMEDNQDLKLLGHIVHRALDTSLESLSDYTFTLYASRSDPATDYNQVVRLLQRLMRDEEVKLHINGTTKGQLNKLHKKWDISWNQALTVSGFNNITLFKPPGNVTTFLYTDMLVRADSSSAKLTYVAEGTLANVAACSTLANTAADADGYVPAYEDAPFGRANQLSIAATSRIAVDVYANASATRRFGFGSIEMMQGLPDAWLPHASATDVIIDLDAGTTEKSVREGREGEVVLWRLRPTAVFVSHWNGNMTALVEEESAYLTDAMAGMEWEMRVRVDDVVDVNGTVADERLMGRKGFFHRKCQEWVWDDGAGWSIVRPYGRDQFD